MSDRPRLDSWKEISAYLRRDVTTLIRWERTRGLPVHRVPGGGNPRVFAYRDELDAWLAARSNEPDAVEQSAEPPAALPSRPDRRFISRAGFAIVAVGLMATAAAAVWKTGVTRPGVRRLEVTGVELRAFDGAGESLWAHRLPGTSAKAANSPWWIVRDLDGDGAEESLAAVVTQGAVTNAEVDYLMLFSAGGGLRWSRSLNDRLEFREGSYGPPWSSQAMAAYSAGGSPRVAWAVHHYTWWPGLLASFDLAGRRTATFVNSGWIGRVEPSKDNRHLILSGVSNSKGAYFVAVLDAARPAGHSPEDPGSPYECLGCPSDGPLLYHVFPRSDVSRHQAFPGAAPSIIVHGDGGVQVHVHENSGPTIAATIYDLAPDFSVRSARFSDSFVEWHARLEREGRLDHPFERCPDRAARPVRTWTAASGWRTVTTPAR